MIRSTTKESELLCPRPRVDRLGYGDDLRDFPVRAYAALGPEKLEKVAARAQ